MRRIGETLEAVGAGDIPNWIQLFKQGRSVVIGMEITLLTTAYAEIMKKENMEIV